MKDGGVVALRDLSQPESPGRTARLVSSDPAWAEFELTDGGALIPSGTPVGFQTSQATYLGHVEGGETLGNRHLRVRVDHSLALEDVLSIQKLWSQERQD